MHPTQMEKRRKEERRALLQLSPENYETKKVENHANKVCSPNSWASLSWQCVWFVWHSQGLLSSLQQARGEVGMEASCTTFTRAPWDKVFTHRWDRWDCRDHALMVHHSVLVCRPMCIICIMLKHNIFMATLTWGTGALDLLFMK